MRSLLSQITFLRTYSKVKSNGKKETWNETVERYLSMMRDRFPTLADDITKYGQLIHDMKILPSMRMLQFAGDAILRDNARGYNCSALAIDSAKAIAELFYLLMCGTGVGYSIQRHHINDLIQDLTNNRVTLENYTVPDSKEGWAESTRLIMLNPNIQFDYSLIRPAGAPVSSGGTASGPESLKQAHENIRRILLQSEWPNLRPIEVHDICCHIADVVVVGGVRRSAMICLFDKDDEEMLKAKSGEWWKNNPQRARANNSALLLRSSTSFSDFNRIMNKMFLSHAGEPGVYWSSSKELLTNPCGEIALNSNQFCNLTTINFSTVVDAGDFAQRARAATFFGTLQASFTDFHYLRERWKKITDEEALLGVSMTGLAHNWNKFLEFVHDGFVREVGTMMLRTNFTIANKIGIKPSARIATVKPEGTTSTILDTTSGIHAGYAKYYVRRIRIGVDHPIAKFLDTLNLPKIFWEDDVFNPKNKIFACPMFLRNALTRNEENAISQLERMKLVREHWIVPSHRYGANTHNVSITVSYHPEEAEEIVDWMWQNRNHYNGISLLPYDGGTYVQMPFEEISEKRYTELIELLPQISLDDISYDSQHHDEQGRVQVLACAGGACEIT